MAEMPPSYDEDAAGSAINVVIVGETQQGKSTLIKQLSSYAGVDDPNIGIGTGNRACTSAVSTYDLDIYLREYQLVDKDGNIIEGKTFKQLCKLRSDDADVVPGTPKNEHPIRFSFVDTPGLGDSDGRDQEFMASIIARIAKLGTVNAVIYVRSIDNPFGKEFKDFYQYFRRCLPTVADGMIVVNSSFTTESRREYIRNNQSRAALRRESFRATTGLELPHFFMDNNPEPDEPFAMLESWNEIYRLLDLLSVQRSTPVGQVKLLKTKQMRFVDQCILTAVNDVTHRLNLHLNSQKAAADAVKGQEIDKAIRIHRAKTALEKLTTTRDELLGQETIQLITFSVDLAYDFWDHTMVAWRMSVPQQPYRYEAPCEITEVRKTSGSHCKWIEERQTRTFWSAVLKAKRCEDLVGTATIYTSGELKHQTQLHSLELDIARTQSEVEHLQSIYTPDANADMDKLVQQVESCNRMRDALEAETCDMALYEQFRFVYGAEERPSRDVILLFMQEFDKSVAEMYRKS